MEDNGENKNKLLDLWSTNFQQMYQDSSLWKRLFSTNYAAMIGYSHAKRSLPHTFNKNELEMIHGPKCKSKTVYTLEEKKRKILESLD